MPYWITDTLSTTPAFAWIYLGVGVPCALAVLPRPDWRDRALVVALAFVLGSALLTAWMFALGTFFTLRLDWILGGTGVFALVGAAVAWVRRRPPDTPPEPRQPLAFDEKLLLGLIVVALVVRWLGVAYWTFTAYDALWVYGYEGRLYTLLGHIPPEIDYYPQFIPLQYTFGQLVAGGVNDHAARAVLPFLHIGGILAAFTLAHRVFNNRRAGFILAGLWALYPHVGAWSRFGDLEIPLAFTFTLAAAFFLLAWTGTQHRRHYAVLSGLVFSVAMWTKPTAGAFALGVALMVAIELVRVRFDLRGWWSRFELALLAGVASVPLGGVWYLRNVLLGHAAVDFPPSYWLTQAERSGEEWGWLLLLVGVLLITLYTQRTAPKPDTRRVMVGVALILLGIVPSILVPHRMTPLEWVALAAGVGWLAWTLIPFIRTSLPHDLNAGLGRAVWGYVLALPYFVTYFWLYSFHYRLSFTVVPLLLLPAALLLACLLTNARVSAWKSSTRRAYAALLVLAALPGVVAPLYDVNAGWDWLWSNELPNDFNRYDSGNRALMNVVGELDTFMHETNAEPVVVAPGMQRLPFFYPLVSISDAAPTDLDALEGVTHFVFSSHAMGAYEFIPLENNQVVASLGRGDLLPKRSERFDSHFFYEVYEPQVERRWQEPWVNGFPEGEVMFGDFAQFYGFSLGGLDFWAGREVGARLVWHVQQPAPEDYTIFLHLLDDGELVAAWDGKPAQSRHAYYPTTIWEPGEYFVDERVMELDGDDLPPPGDDYELAVGMYHLDTGERVPIFVNGEPAGDSLTLRSDMIVREEPPDES